MASFTILDGVRGTAAVGDSVTYEDQANPRRYYHVVETPNAAHPFDYKVVDVQDGSFDYSDLRQSGWTFWSFTPDAEAAELVAMFGEPISTYTAEQAVEDGYLFAVPADLVTRPTFLTASVVGLCTPPKGSCEDFKGRVADVLTMTRLAFSGGDLSDRMRTDITVKIGGRNVNLWAVVDGAGLTIMVPSDY